MEWKGLSKNVNAERSKGYHVASAEMMTNAYRRCRYGIRPEPAGRKARNTPLRCNRLLPCSGNAKARTVSPGCTCRRLAVTRSTSRLSPC
ncbi:hypothetical protein FHK92_03485 [Pseudomonas brassicacearum subsp. neoaurantiaca]|uniref:Uncharacterized protein n=1 Tax=Pseudomonas brassicacearum subsp. neoaurantiaca TaxID=494916 RepID=A0A7V8RI09_9PSED|nr:hypothetical protein [Pseudomonas brassicacearum subsp. neoaurantiaca]